MTEINESGHDEDKETEELKKKLLEQQQQSNEEDGCYFPDNPNPDNNSNNNNGSNDSQDQDQEIQDYPGKLIKSYTLKTLNDTEEIWYYNSERGIFVPNAEPIIKHRIELDKGMPFMDEKGNMQQSDLTIKDVNEYIAHIQRRTPTSREAFNRSIEWIATNNCMVNLSSGETQPFSPDFMNTTHIPVKYVAYNSDHIHNLKHNHRPNGTGSIADFFRFVECPCPAIMKFLYQIITPEDVDLVLDFMAYCLWRTYKFNFWMLFNGAGLNGKSVLLTLIERFLGKHNVSGETLDRLLHERFAVANLFQKMVNVDADVSADVIFNNTGIIKKLTGNDLHAGEFKYKKPFAFRNYAKLIFSCNKIPDTEDYTDAFFRRILIINFTQQFFGEKDDPDLIDKLCTEEEFSGLLYELLCRLPRILREGIKKITSEGMAETYDKYTRGSNPVKYFVEKGLEYPIPGCKITKVHLYDHYEKFCRDFGLAPESPQSFSRKLSDDFHLKTKRGRINGEQVYCWEDIRLKDWVEEEKHMTDTLEDFSDAMKESMK
jgi:P4 family phage/plasmid primase-like protien